MLKPGLESIITKFPGSLSTFEKRRYTKTVSRLSKNGVPKKLAQIIASIRFAAQLPRLVDLCEADASKAGKVFEIHQKVGEALAIEKLIAAAEDGLSGLPYWDRLATRKLLQEMRQQQGDATALSLKSGDPGAWLTRHEDLQSDLVSAISTLASEQASFAQFALAGDAVREFMRAIKSS